MARVWLSRQIIPGSWFQLNTLIYLGLTGQIKTNKGMGKQTQSQFLRDWFDCLGGEAPTSGSNASHRTSLTGRISS